jgi:hypothetical protein
MSMAEFASPPRKDQPANPAKEAVMAASKARQASQVLGVAMYAARSTGDIEVVGEVAAILARPEVIQAHADLEAALAKFSNPNDPAPKIVAAVIAADKAALSILERESDKMSAAISAAADAVEAG